MALKKLSRTTYRDPTESSNPLRSGDATRSEAAMDMDEYYRPLEQVHGSGLHEFGVGQGLRVNATNAAQGVRVLAGIAIDVAGRHISLAGGGQAEVGVSADAPGAAPILVVVDPVTGALVPTAGLTGEKLVVIRHWETFDANAWNLYGAYVFNHTPWIRLVPAAGYVDDGDEVILGKVTLDGAGSVTGLVPGPRHSVGVPAETVHLRRGHQAAGSPNFGVDDAAYGEIHPRPSGGIQMTVPAAADWIELQRQNGGSMAKISLAGEAVNFRRNDGKETVRVDTNLGNLEAGGDGVEGDILVKDAQSRLVITLDGDGALGVFGAEGKAGELRVKTGARGAANTFQVLGQTGDVYFKGKLKDPANSHPGVGHVELKDLTDGGTTSLHKHNLGVLGRWGAIGTKIGVTTAKVEVSWGGNEIGGVTINFADWSTTPTGSGFLGATLRGYKGVFAADPQIVLGPGGLGLSTYDDTYFDFYYSSINTNRVTLGWGIDGAFSWPQYFYLLVVGPIA